MEKRNNKTKKRIKRVIAIIIIIIIILLLLQCCFHKPNLKNNKLPETPIEEIDNSQTINNMIVYYRNSNLSRTNPENIEIIEYTNNVQNSVNINTNSIGYSCIGTKSNQLLAKENLNITISFALEKNGRRSKSLVLKPNEKVYIFMHIKYKGDQFPDSKVKCNYSVNVRAE